ncbi:MAG: hypothetical protein M1828_004578 [Chrysothrix sp. TS-e1954]|nr:MAG: hypothetical protein M1828_004578 [Chrysothrix sp. TS-e1954]
MSTPARKHDTRSASRDATPSHSQTAASGRPRRQGKTGAVATTNDRELPTLTGKVSNAYGGAGRSALPEHLAAVTEGQNLGDLLDAKRTVADAELGRQKTTFNEDEEEESSHPSRSRQSASSSALSSAGGSRVTRRSNRQTHQPATINEEDETHEQDEVVNDARVDETGNDTTRLETERTFSKEAHISHGAHGSQTVPDRFIAENATVASSTSPLDQVRPQNVIAHHPRPWSPWKILIFTLFLFLSSWAFYSGTSLPPDSLAFAGRTQLGGRFEYFRWKVNKVLNSTIAEIRGDELRYNPEHEHNQLISKIDHQQIVLDGLVGILPDTLVLPKDKGTGTVTIPDYFWNALIAKSSYELGFSNDQSVWQQFLLNNQEQLFEMIEAKTGDVINQTSGGQGLIKPVDVVRMINRNNREIMQQVDMSLASVERRYKAQYGAFLDGDLKRMVDARFKDIPWDQIYAIGRLFHVQNQYRALHTIDWFSATNGAVVDPMLTSPMASAVLRPGPNLFETFHEHQFPPFDWKWPINTASGTKVKGVPPSVALTPWEGPKDCWCPAPSEGEYDLKNKVLIPGPEGHGKNARAQLVVIMPHTVVPISVTVDHIPKDATLDPLSAPKDMELWIAIPDPTIRRQIFEAELQYRRTPPLGNDVSKNMWDDTDHAGLPAEFVRVGSWQYDINEENHVQTFTLPLDLVNRFGVKAKSNKAAIRVLNDWGAGSTCLYKLRLEGKAPQQFEDRTALKANWPRRASTWETGS